MMRATEVAHRLNLDRHSRSWRGRCPCCDYSGNTFSLRAEQDGRAKLFCANGCQRDELAKAVARAINQPLPAPPTANVAAAPERNRDRALALWHRSEPAIGTLADRYLMQRWLPGLAASSELRFRADTPHPEGGRLPALVALVTDVSGSPLGVHRTYLSRDGSKALVEPAKATLGPIWGGAIRLHTLDPSKSLVIGEGIETAASAGLLTGLPAWAAISAGNLAKGLLLPQEARSVVIAADPDKAGADAAREAWRRWTDEGRTVRIATPNGPGDFNELLLAREVRHG